MYYSGEGAIEISSLGMVEKDYDRCNQGSFARASQMRLVTMYHE